MSLKKLFIIAAVAISVVFLLASSAYYLIAKQQMTSEGEKNIRVTANSVSVGITNLVKQLDNSVTSIASNPAVIQLFRKNNLQSLVNKSDQLSALTSALSIRLLQPDVDQPDESRIPFMGFADLVLVRSALESDPAPLVIAKGTDQSHIAVARKVIYEGRVIGVVLGSFSTDWLTRTVTGIDLVSGRFELKQGELSLASTGDSEQMDTVATGKLILSASNWALHYWAPQGSGMSGLAFSIVTVLALLFFPLTLWLVSKKMLAALTSDQETLVRLVKEMLTVNKPGRYPVKLVEFEKTTAQLLKLKPYVSAGMSNEDDDTEINEADILSEQAKARAIASSASGLQVSEAIDVPESVFQTYDVGGIVEETFTTQLVFDIGRAFGSEAYEAGQQTVIVARDGRLSSTDLSDTLIKGLQGSGRKVIDLGVVPTPLLYFATHFFELETASAIMVTGSHKQTNYNGMKMVLAGRSLSAEGIQKLKKRILEQDFSSGNGVLEKREIEADYLTTITDDIDIGRQMKVVVDCGNGVAGAVAPKLLKRLGCDVIELHCDVDGNFPNHLPDPSIAENLQELIDTVRAHNADLGVAFDGDGDQLGVVDSSGVIIWPDRQMMVFAADVLSREPGADIIFDVKCSRHLASEIAQYGGRPLMWKTGHSLIKTKMNETGAALAGEMSGHIFFKERWYGFEDAIYASVRLLEVLSADTRSSAEVFKQLPDAVNTPELNVPMAEKEKFAFVKAMKKQINIPKAKIIDIDGLRVEFPGGWGLVRASNTSPSLGVRFEAKDEKSLKQLQNIFKEWMVKVKPDIQLPF